MGAICGQAPHGPAAQCSPAGGCGIRVCIRPAGSCHSGGAKGDRFRALSRRGQDRVQGAWRETAPRAPTLPPPGPPASPGTARRFSLSPHQRDRMGSELACRTSASATARWASMPRLRWHRGRSRWRRSWESATSPDCRYGRSRRTDVSRAGHGLMHGAGFRRRARGGCPGQGDLCRRALVACPPGGLPLSPACLPFPADAL